MPTLLVTRKMSPELRERVAASVRGRRATPGARLRPRSVSWLRFGVLALLVVATWGFVAARQRAAERLEAARGLLLERLDREARGIGPSERALVERLRPWLERAQEAPTNDFIADELAAEGALARTLSRPTVYVRLPLASGTSDADLSRGAAQSFKDALVLCLLDPPATRTEQALAGRARSSFAGGESMRAVAHVERLLGALLSLPLLTPEFRARVAAAESELDLDRLERALERAPLASARRAFAAELFLFALDEPGLENGPTELDGERAHHVRVGLVDLAAGKPLLNLRRRVDPSWISPARRAEYAAAIDSCSLALDVHGAVADARAKRGR